MGTVVWMATCQSQIHRCATMSQANLGTRMMRVCIKTLTRLPLSCAIGARASKAKLCESTIVVGQWRDGFAVRGRQQPQQQLQPRQALPLLQPQQPQPQPQLQQPQPRRPQLPLQPRLQPQQLRPQLQPLPLLVILMLLLQVLVLLAIPLPLLSLPLAQQQPQLARQQPHVPASLVALGTSLSTKAAVCPAQELHPHVM